MNKTTNKFTPEVGERAVRMVPDHSMRRAAATAIAVKIGRSAYPEWPSREQRSV